MSLFLKRNIKGATIIEYGILMVGVAIALITLVFSMGDSLLTIFQKLVTKIASAL